MPGLLFSTSAIDACAREVVRQGAGAFAVKHLCDAVEIAWDLTAHDPMLNVSMLKTIGATVDPRNNDFRHTPVVFANGGSSATHAEIPRMLDNWVASVNDACGPNGMLIEDARLLTREFLWIHPFKDGNGRTGFILYNLFRGNLRGLENNVLPWLYPLPEFKWM